MQTRQTFAGEPLPSGRRAMMIAVAAVASVMLAGCAQYLSRADKIAFSAGNSKAHNAAIHTIDPWPRSAFRTSLKTPGVRAEAAMERYRAGQASTGAAANFAPALTAGGASSSGQ